mmetsp:Transcript_9852/g.24335  ORF Transcript_9852/g.24335 Transcript_9852/m.24335 type:complete len:122 (+) Transcript_9852:304-669(+)
MPYFPAAATSPRGTSEYTKQHREKKTSTTKSAAFEKKSSPNGPPENAKNFKAPFHMKQALKRKIALIEQYKQLKSHGSLEEFLSKRRKKMVQRDHRLFPRARNESVHGFDASGRERGEVQE